MATKKIEENVEKTAKEVAENKEKTYKIRIPIDQLNPKDKEVIVGVNEKYAKIIRGEDTEVSEPVYEVLKNAGLV
jgi:hypothetical protein